MQEYFTYFTTQNIWWSLSQKHWRGLYDTLDTLRLVSRYMGRDKLISQYMGHIMNCIRYMEHFTTCILIRLAIHGTQYHSYRVTWDAIRILPRYESYRYTWNTIWLISWYVGNNTTRIVIHGTRCNSYCDTWDTLWLVPRYIGLATTCFINNGQ